MRCLPIAQHRSPVPRLGTDRFRLQKQTTSVPEVPKWDPVAAEARAAEAAKKRVLALEIEKTRKKEAARREIARLDALRREEARAAMRREAEVLEAKRLEAFSKKRKEHKSAGTAKPPSVPKPPQPLVQPPPTDDQTVTKENTSRRQSGGLFGRPGIVTSRVRHAQSAAAARVRSRQVPSRGGVGELDTFRQSHGPDEVRPALGAEFHDWHVVRRSATRRAREPLSKHRGDYAQAPVGFKFAGAG